MSGAFVRSVGGLAAPSGPAATVLHGIRRQLRPAAGAAEVELYLPDSLAWSVRVRRGGATVRCAAGSVWLTREGDPEDRVLAAGQAFRIEKPGRIAVLALGAARIVFAPLPRSCGPPAATVSDSSERLERPLGGLFAAKGESMNAVESSFTVSLKKTANAVAQRLARWWRADDGERYLAGATDLADLERRLRALERGHVTPLFVTTFNF